MDRGSVEYQLEAAISKIYASVSHKALSHLTLTHSSQGSLTSHTHTLVTRLSHITHSHTRHKALSLYILITIFALLYVVWCYTNVASGTHIYVVVWC